MEVRIVLLSAKRSIFAPAGHQLLAFQLGRQMNAERAEETSVAGRQNPSGEDQARGGIDFFDVVAGGIVPWRAGGQGRNFSGGGLKSPSRSGPAPLSPSARP